MRGLVIAVIDIGDGSLPTVGGQTLILRSLPALMHLHLRLVYDRGNGPGFCAEEPLLGAE